MQAIRVERRRESGYVREKAREKERERGEGLGEWYMERKRERVHSVPTPAAHAPSILAPRGPPRLPPRVIGSLALPLLSLTTAPDRTYPTLFVLLRPPTSFSHIRHSLFLLPILSISLLPSFSHSPFLPNVLRLSLLPSDIRIQIQVRTSAALSLRRTVLPPYISSANNIRFHRLSQRRDAARRLAPSPANVHLLLPLLSPIDDTLL